MKAIIQAISLTIVMFAAVSMVASQDLGSANKLFGGSKPATPSSKKTTPKKVAGSRHASNHTAAARRKPASSSKTQARKNNRKSHDNSTATATRPSNPPVDKSTRPRFSGKDGNGVTANNARPVETKVSPADEARFEGLIDQANNARDDRDYARAESLYRSARDVKPRDARAIYGLGNIYSDQQRWEESENAYRTALQLEPSSANTYVALSYVLTQPLAVSNLSDRYAEAEKLARRATELSPRSALAFDQLGTAMEMRGQVGAETENAYRRAVQLDPTFAPAYAHLGRLLRRRGMNDQSKEAYRQAVEHSTDVGTTVLVADVMQSEQRYADSVPLLKQVLDADPKNPSGLLMYGHALTVTGQYKDAEAALRKALTVSSDGYQANVLLASLYMRQGAYELAENALLQSLRWAPPYENRQVAQQFVILGQGYSKVGKSEQAQRAYSQAARLDPDRGMVSGRFRGQ
ncbi:MAG: tetratricopeptide repeat protein [Acidobacteria bacterium]|nr:tetratricopeptide repeat protein [Acidobacteriota bacterium]